MTTAKTLTKSFNEIEILISKTMEYLMFPSVVGHEQIFMRHLKRDFRQLGLQVREHEGLLEVKGKKPHSAIVCAHIDRHGLISLGKGEYAYAAQYMRETKYNEANIQSETELKNILGRFEGEMIYAYDDDSGLTLGQGTIEQADDYLTKGKPIFKVNLMGYVTEGTPLAYARTADMNDEYLKGQLDNTISIGTIYALYNAGFQGTTLFTVEEEIGKSWVHIANYLQKTGTQTKDLVVIDTSPFADTEPVKNGHVVFRNRDFREYYNPGMLEAFKVRCQELGIHMTVKDEYLLSIGKTTEQLGSTELGRLIFHSKNEWSGSTIQIPTLAYHTSYETTSKAAILNYFRFLKNILIKNPLNFTYTVKESINA